MARDTGPATVGLFRPQIVIPEWLLAAPPEALRLVIAHERSHVEAGDNTLLVLGIWLAILTPWNGIAWWQVRRMRLAIEVDCDRRVLRGGNDVRRYAKTLVDVGMHRSAYHFGLSASPRSISSIEKRLRIMSTPKISGWRRSTATFAILSFAVAAASILITPPAMPLAMAGITRDVTTASPREYVGNYRMSSMTILRVAVRDGRLVAAFPGMRPELLTRTSGTTYRFGRTNARFRFALNSTGHVIGVVLRQNGAATEAPRIGVAGVDAIHKVIAERVRSQTMTPGSALAVRQLILGIQSGKPDYSALSAQLAAGTRAMLSHLQATLKPWGALRSIEFRGVDSKGWDHYIVHFQHGAASVGIALDSYGVVVGAGISAAS